MFKKFKKVLKKYDLPTSIKADANRLAELVAHDKKASSNNVTIIYCEEIGSFEMRSIEIPEIKKYITEVF